jgi:hypothetical protein
MIDCHVPAFLGVDPLWTFVYGSALQPGCRSQLADTLPALGCDRSEFQTLGVLLP